MHKKLYTLFLLILLSNLSLALTRNDVQVIEARENMAYLTQKIATDYFLLYQKPYDINLQNKFSKNIKTIEKNVLSIANISENETTFAILNFYNYRLSYIKDLLLRKPTLKDAIFILDASEDLLEGAIAISQQQHYESSKEETMLVHYKELKYLIEAVSKYYMASQIGIQKEEHKINMKTTIRGINKRLKTVSLYEYKLTQKNELKELKNIWNHNQSFFNKLEEDSYSNLLLSSNAYIKVLLLNLENQHKQNL